MGTNVDPRYRQVGYGYYSTLDGLDWRAVWLDVESINTGRLVFYVFPDGRVPNVYTGIIYQTLAEVPAIHR